MSRQNKVNPGTYTQRGRLSQDDVARELRKQSVIGSPQPVNTRTRPHPGPAGDTAPDLERSADNETMMVEASPHVETRPASRVTRNMTATKAAPSNAKARAANAKTARTPRSKRTTSNAKTRKAVTTPTKRTGKPTRKAVLARNVGGGGAAPSSTTKRRKS